jgi:hypothetical protein
LLLLHGIADGQNVRKSRGRIINVEAGETVSVEIDIRATDRDLIVPYCSQDADGRRDLCSGFAYLEVLNGKMWTRAKPRRGLAGVLGVPSKDALHTVHIAPEHDEHFVFSFSPGFFGIEKGKHLRVKVDAWQSEEAMRTRDADTGIASPGFTCP